MDQKAEKRRDTLINIAYWAVILLLLYFFFKYVIAWLLPLFIGLVVARVLNPLIKFISKKTRIPRQIVAFILVILFLAVIGTLLWILIYQLVGFATEQVYKLPGYYRETLLPALLEFEDFLAENVGIQNMDIIGSITDAVTSLPTAFNSLLNLASQAPGMVLRVMFTILFSLFGCGHYENITGFVMRQLSESKQTFLRDTFSSLKRSLVSYYGAYLKIMLVAFAELTVGLSIVRGTFSILPAFAIAMVDFLPVLGCGTVMFPWALIHLITGNIPMALGIMIVYVVVLVVRQFIEPKIVGDQLGINPFLTLTAIYIGYLSMGVLGMILLPIIVTIIADLQKHEKIRLFK